MNASHPVKPKRLIRPLRVVVPVAAVAVGVAIFVWAGSARLPKRFATVVAGELYRSGSVSPAQLARLQRDFGIRRVICLLDPGAAQTQAEQAAADRLGIDWQNVPLPGNGASTPAERRRIRELLEDRAAGPTLVHCGAGTNRTGLVIGMYRLHEQGWTLARVLDELRAFGFEDEPQHENLRQALALEAAAAAAPAAGTAPAGRP